MHSALPLCQSCRCAQHLEHLLRTLRRSPLNNPISSDAIQTDLKAAACSCSEMQEAKDDVWGEP